MFIALFNSHSVVLRRGIALLDQFIQADRIRDMICSFSLVQNNDFNSLANTTLQNNLYEPIINDVASLPERIANKMELNVK